LMSVGVFVFVFVPGFVEAFMGIMKMNVSFANHLANEVIGSEKQEGAAGDSGEPGADCFTKRRTEQGNGEAERRGYHYVASAS